MVLQRGGKRGREQSRSPSSRIVGPIMGERIGIFGGTFDPIHVGHLVAAVNAKHALGLDRVLMVVANVPWQKAGDRAVSSAEDRLALVEAAVGDVPGLEASRDRDRPRGRVLYRRHPARAAPGRSRRRAVPDRRLGRGRRP